MPDLLIELFSEEIPARLQRKAATDLKKCVTNKLVDAGLTYKAACEYWTPRRLTLDIRGLSTRSKDIYEERKGPNIQAPQQAIDGFLRAAGLTDISQAKIAHDSKKGDFYIAEIIKKGRSAEEIVADIMPDVIQNFSWSKSMRWGKDSAESGALKWIRPLQNILCVFGPEIGETQIIPFSVGSLQSNDLTYGHRFLSDGRPIKVRRFDDYITQLEAHNVILDAEKRKNIILTDAQTLCFAKGLELIEDSALIEEVTGLVEWPVVLMSNFDEAFLEMPSEVIRLTIRTHQKCFVTCKQDEKTKLSNHFILVSNILASDEGKEIAKGNRRVVNARLSDALHFWQTDQCGFPDIAHLESYTEYFTEKLYLDLRKPLDQRIAHLDHLDVTFHAKLGTQGERVKRIAALAQTIAPMVKADPTLARRAAILAKADLQTEIVGEFPELQGIIGRKYALLQGEDPRVAEAIEDHYRPLGPTDRIPQEPIAIAVALADKIDMLIGFWLINEKPTGSKDPYALRRAALGIIRLVLSQDCTINLMPLFYNAIKILVKQKAEYIISEEETKLSGQTVDNHLKKQLEIGPDLLSFFHERLKIHLKEEGVHYDIIEAVLTKDADDFKSVARFVEALSAFISTSDGNNLLAAVKRVVNILENEIKKGTKITDMINSDLFVEEAEKNLYQAIIDANEKVNNHIITANFLGKLDALVLLVKPIDTFFEKVLVNDKNADIRTNRLALLERVRSLALKVADFSKIAV